MSTPTRGFLGRRRPARDPRLPPGQYDAGTDWPVLTAEVTPAARSRPLDDDGRRPGRERRTPGRGQDMHALPQSEYHGDIHCVTTWSKLGTSFGGVSVDLLLEAAAARSRTRPTCSPPRRPATRPTCRSTHLAAGKAWIVWTHDGKPLPREHGGPVRLLVPHLYFWKSAKWVTRLTLLDHDQQGFWERNGYHDLGDPWREQRYQGD